LKDRSRDGEASEAIIDALLCRWLNVNPLELKRLPYEVLQRYKAVYESILENKPELLLGL
jgi:hypothetical protein